MESDTSHSLHITSGGTVNDEYISHNRTSWSRNTINIQFGNLLPCSCNQHKIENSIPTTCNLPILLILSLSVYLSKLIVIVQFRVIWVLLLLGALTLFSLAFTEKILYLLSNPKSVNVEVIYTDKLPFPSVTMCNENKYRYM